MNLIPNTTCSLCHRQYPSFRGRCPYCGTKKPKVVRSAVPETDSVTRGTRAAKSAAETVNMQMLIGSVLLLAVIIATIVMVSLNVSSDVKDQQIMKENQQAEQEPPAMSPLSPPTPTPSPSPSPLPEITQMAIYCPAAWPDHDYNGLGFYGKVGDSYQMQVTWYPREILATPEWTSSDETVATVDDTGLIKLVGEGSATITVKVNQREGTCPIVVT